MKAEITAESREVVVSEFEALQEMLVSKFAVQHFPSTLQESELHADGTLEFGNQRLPHTDRVHDALVAVCGMSVAFDRDTPFDELKWNYQKRKLRKTCGLTVCISNGTVVGIGPENYGYPAANKGAVKTLDLLTEMQIEKRLFEFDSAIVSDEGVKLNLLSPGATVEPLVGDVIKIGSEVTNTETGGMNLKSPPGLKANMWSLRLVCLNGMSQKTERTSVYYSQFGTMSCSSKRRAFLRKLGEASESALADATLLYEGISDLAIFDTDLLALHRTVKRNVGGKLDADEVLGIASSDRIEIANSVRDRNVTSPPKTTDFSIYDIHNSITAIAREQRLSLRQPLERIGGSVLHTAQKRRHEIAGIPFSLN